MNKRLFTFTLLILLSVSIFAQGKINPNQIEWRIPVAGDITATSFSGTPAPVGVTGVSIEGISESIKSLITGTITAMAIYERNKDDVFSINDPRKYWYKKQDTSWYQELGEFPERVLLVGADSLYVVDLDTQEVYMEFERNSTGENLLGNTTKILTSIYMKNGVLFSGQTKADLLGNLTVVDFFSDNALFITTTSTLVIQNNISQRNEEWFSTNKYTIITNKYLIINRQINSVHANIVNGTLYAVVGTDGGLSQINMDTGVVWDNTDTATNKKINCVKLFDDGKIYFSCQDSATETDYQKLYKRDILTADVSGYDTGSVEYSITAGTPAGIPIDTATAEMNDIVITGSSLSESGQNKVILGKETKLTILHENSTPAQGWYQYKTNTYDTGLLYNDTAVVGSYLNGLDSVVADRSYRGNTLTNEGTVAVSADVTAPFGVSALFDGTTEYLWSADTDFDFATKTALAVSFWLKPSDGQPATAETIIAEYIYNTDGTFFISLGTDGKISFTISNGTTSQTTTTSSAVFANGAVSSFAHVYCVYSGGSYLRVYINGVLAGSNTTSIHASLDVSVTANFTIGSKNAGVEKLTGYLSQVKIFNSLANNVANYGKAEYELGKNTIGKTCLIQGNSAQVNSVSANGDDVLISTGDGTYTGFVQTISGGATILTIEATTNANNLVLASKDYTVYSAVTASALHLIRPDIDFLKYVQNLVYKPKETIFIKGSWASGGSSITVTNPYITDNSNIIAMPQSAPEGSWYLTGQAVGTVTINSLSTEAYSVDYLLMINN